MLRSAGSTRVTRHDARAPHFPSHAVARARPRGRARIYDVSRSAPAARTAGTIGAGEMSAGFQAVQWNRRKLVYDAFLLGGVILFIAMFMTVGALRNPPRDLPAWIGLRIKAFGTCAFVMLTIILMIGPLARLDSRFLALLYNRR